MGKKMLTLITLVVLTILVTGCERPGLTETAVPDGWLLRMLGWVAPTPAVKGWGWMREALVAKFIPILVGLLILLLVVSIFFVFDAWLRKGKAPTGKTG